MGLCPPPRENSNGRKCNGNAMRRRDFEGGVFCAIFLVKL
jgi:hypothetical protein